LLVELLRHNREGAFGRAGCNVRIEETIMRSGIFVLLFGSSALIAVSALAQTTVSTANTPAATALPKAGPADLCQELLTYAEMKITEPLVTPAGQASAPGAALPRADGRATGTQGGGSVSPNSSTNMRAQAAAPPTVPVATGAALEAAASPHASGSSHGGAGATPAGTPDAEFKFAGGVTLQQVRDTAKSSDRQACRDTVQKLRRAGADLPAALIALAAHEPDLAKRQ
jgi:hypothetical protein